VASAGAAATTSIRRGSRRPRHTVAACRQRPFSGAARRADPRRVWRSSAGAARERELSQSDLAALSRMPVRRLHVATEGKHPGCSFEAHAIARAIARQLAQSCRRVPRRDCWSSSNSIANGAAIESPQAAVFVEEQQPGPALLLIVPSGHAKPACTDARILGKQQRASSRASRRATAQIRPSQQRANARTGAPRLLLCREAAASPRAPGRRPERASGGRCARHSLVEGRGRELCRDEDKCGVVPPSRASGRLASRRHARRRRSVPRLSDGALRQAACARQRECLLAVRLHSARLARAARRPAGAWGVRAGARAHRANAGAKVRPCHPDRHEERGTEGRECLFDGDAADVREGRADHWKISVVQSPPWRRTSWARAGPSGRSPKSR
jgi:hypothetical protein